MKKNIIIAVLSILLVSSVVFGLVQRTDASQQRQLAGLNARLAQENEKQARAQMQMAMVSMAEAAQQVQLAKEECAKKK